MNKASFPKAIGLLGKPFPALEGWAAYYGCGVLILFAVFWVAAEVIGRFAFAHSFLGVVDIVCLIVVAVTFLCLSSIQRNNAHIRMDLLENKLSKGRVGFTVQCLILVLSAIVAAVMCYVTASYALMIYVEQRVTESILWPYWSFTALMPIGLFFLTIRLGIQIKDYLRKTFLKT